MNLTFDTPTAEEFPLVFDSWANSFRKSPWAGCISNRLYDEVMRTTLAEIIDRGARIRVAVLTLEDGTRRVLGYSVSEPSKGVLHWVYVKQPFRGVGVGRKILEEACPTGDWKYTFRTRASTKFLGGRFEHDPVPARVRG